jgi:hypothetical protein
MDENRNTETFVLGLIVAAIVYFLFRRQLDRALGVSSGGNGGGNGTGSTKNGGGGGCGCGGGCASQSIMPPTNPGVSPGNQSYNSEAGAFSESSVISVAHPSFFEQAYGS